MSRYRGLDRAGDDCAFQKRVHEATLEVGGVTARAAMPAFSAKMNIDRLNFLRLAEVIPICPRTDFHLLTEMVP
jgi:hypothetical protein